LSGFSSAAIFCSSWVMRKRATSSEHEARSRQRAGMIRIMADDPPGLRMVKGGRLVAKAQE
jgi:hypothetical protein